MKTREEIQLEYENQRAAISNHYYAKIEAARAARDAALAELDDPMARLIAAAKAWHDNHWLSFGECSHSVCVELRDAIDALETRVAE